MEKKWLDFGDLDLIFKVTAALWMSIFDHKSLSPSYFWKQIVHQGQTLCIVSLRWLKDLLRFWVSCPNFKWHHTIKTVKRGLSPEIFGGFWPNLHRNTIGTWEGNYYNAKSALEPSNLNRFPYQPHTLSPTNSIQLCLTSSHSCGDIVFLWKHCFHYTNFSGVRKFRNFTVYQLLFRLNKPYHFPVTFPKLHMSTLYSKF